MQTSLTLSELAYRSRRIAEQAERRYLAELLSVVEFGLVYDWFTAAAIELKKENDK